MAPVSPVASCGWLQYHLLLIVSPPVSVVHGSTSQYLLSSHLWLHWLSLVAPVMAVVWGSSSTICCRCWLQYRPSCPVAPVWWSVVLGSGISSCRSRLRYLLLSFTAPVSPVVVRSSCGSGSGSSTIYCHFLWLQAVARHSCGCHGCLPSCGFNRQPSSVL